MSTFYAIDEGKLLYLLQRDQELSAMEYAGVDNWEDGGMVREYYKVDPKVELVDLQAIFKQIN